MVIDKEPLIKWVKSYLRFFTIVCDDEPGYVWPNNPAQTIVDIILKYKTAHESGQKNLEGLLPDPESFFRSHEDD